MVKIGEAMPRSPQGDRRRRARDDADRLPHPEPALPDPVSASASGSPGRCCSLGACVLAYANGLTGAFTYDDKAIVRDNSAHPLAGARRRDLHDAVLRRPAGHRHGVPAGCCCSPSRRSGGSTAADPRPLPRRQPPPARRGDAAARAAAPAARPAAAGRRRRGAALRRAPDPRRGGDEHRRAGRDAGGDAAFSDSCSAALRFVDGGGRRRLALVGGARCSTSLANLTKESAAVAPALLFLLLAWRRRRADWAARLRARALRAGSPFYVGAAAVLAAVFRLRALVLGGAIKAARTGIFELENPLAPLPPLGRARRTPARCSSATLGTAGVPAAALRRTSRPGRSGRSTSRDVLVLGGAGAARARSSPRRSGGSRDRSLPALGFLFLCVAALPTSNLLFPTGTIFAERLAYLPSAGFCLIAASWIVGRAPDFDALPRRRLGVLGGGRPAASPRGPSSAIPSGRATRRSSRTCSAFRRRAPRPTTTSPTCRRRRGVRGARSSTTRARREIYPGYWDAWAGRGRDGARARAARATPSAPTPRRCGSSRRTRTGASASASRARPAATRAGAEDAYREGLRHNPRSLPLAYRLALLLAAESRPATLYAWRRALAIEPARCRRGWATRTGSPPRPSREAVAQVARPCGWRRATSRRSRS